MGVTASGSVISYGELCAWGWSRIMYGATLQTLTILRELLWPPLFGLVLLLPLGLRRIHRCRRTRLSTGRAARRWSDIRWAATWR